MNRLTKFGLTLIAAAALAACGTKPMTGTDGPVTTTDGQVTTGDMAGTNPTPDMTQVMTGAVTGEPCTANTDCAKGLGTSPNSTCKKTVNMIAWPGGYCTSPCRAARSSVDDGINTDCPGGNAICTASSGNGECLAKCQDSTECRTDYACFGFSNVAAGCMPKSISECDPKAAGTCPRMCPGQDGGVVDTDAGAPPACFENTCVNIGDGTVGACVPGCDPFTNQGCPGTAGDTDCHASDVTGEGLCTGECTTAGCTGSMMGVGNTCGNFYSDCKGGYGCLNGKCWKYCNTANAATQCAITNMPAGVCTKFSTNTTVPLTVAGICNKSM